MQCSNQVFMFEKSLKANCYHKISEFAKKHPNIVRFSGLFLGIASTIATVVSRIIQIVEVLFKGLAHLFGSLVSKKCEFKTGLCFLGEALFVTIWSTFSIMSSIAKIFKKIVVFSCDPTTKIFEEEANKRVRNPYGIYIG